MSSSTAPSSRMATRRPPSGPAASCGSAATRGPVPDQPRVAILAEGLFGRLTAKTGIGVIRYAPYSAAAVVDSTGAGTDSAEAIGVGGGTPVVATVAEAAALGATVFLIGTAAPGGRIADAYRPQLADVLRRGLTVWNGLHESVLADPALRAAAERGGGTVRELREAPADLPIGGHRERRAGTHGRLPRRSYAAGRDTTRALPLLRPPRRAR